MSVWQKIYNNRAALRLFIPLLLIYAASYFQRTALPGTIYDTLGEDLHINAEQIAYISAAFIYAYSLPQLFAGILIDRYCGSRVVVFGGLIFIAGALTMPFCTTMPAIYISRAVTGLGASTMYLALVKETDRLFDRKDYALMIGIAYFVGYGGGLCGKLPFAALCNYYPWRSVLLGAAVIALCFYLLFLICKAGVPMPPVPKKSFSLTPLKKILLNPYSWLVYLCGTVNFSIYFTIQTVFGEKFLLDFTGMSVTQAAGVTFTMTLICMFTMLNAKSFFKLSGERRKPLIACATGLCFFDALLMITGIFFRMPGWYFITVYCLFAVSAGSPPIFTMVMQEMNSKDSVTQSTSIGNLLGYLAVAVFAPIAGMILKNVDGITASGVTVFSREAYLTVFSAATVVAATSFGVSWLIPETRGHYLRKSDR
ncbi:MAG: MFS transporter [Lentisphaeria bacterium]|nr:MFS transporter [Lentisphaeria bacterium]